MKHKDLNKKRFSRAAVFFIICVVSLLLTGWGLSPNSTKANNLRVTNQTTAFHVENAEIIGDRLNLSLRNVSEKTINGFRLTFNRTLLQTDFSLGRFSIAPGQIEERSYPCDPDELSQELEIEVVVFTDRSFDGSITAANAILDRRDGMRTQLQAVQKLLDSALETSDDQFPATVGQLASQLASLPEEGGPGAKGRALRFGLRDAKADVKNMLRSVIEEPDHRNLDLRQRLADLRSEVIERLNRL
ncbi:MAG TPA: hypothetical protein VJM50_02510 [Pyrinomonadaceae bacterium]|nr:hypothetical protein [Pyrinomonadaceae bacterium]